jgi:hypothetical protein
VRARCPSHSRQWKKRKCKQTRRPAVSFYKLWGARSRDDEFPHYVPWEHKKRIVEPGTKWKIPPREWETLALYSRPCGYFFNILSAPTLYIYGTRKRVSSSLDVNVRVSKGPFEVPFNHLCRQPSLWNYFYSKKVASLPIKLVMAAASSSPTALAMQMHSLLLAFLLISLTLRTPSCIKSSSVYFALTKVWILIRLCPHSNYVFLFLLDFLTRYAKTNSNS